MEKAFIDTLKEDIRERYHNLDRLSLFPGIFLNDYFYGLHDDIDLEAERRLVDLDEVNDHEEIERINRARKCMIAELKKNQEQLQELFEKQAITDSKQVTLRRIDEIKKKIDDEFEPLTDLILCREKYSNLILEIENEANTMKCQYMNNQTFIFVKKEYFVTENINYGMLIQMGDVYLNEIEIKTMLEIDLGENVYTHSEYLNYIAERLESKFNESLPLIIQTPRTLDRKILLIHQFKNYLKKKVPITKHNRDKVFIKINFYRTSTHKTPKSSNEIYSRFFFTLRHINVSYNRLMCMENNIFESLTNVKSLDLSRNYMTSLCPEAFSNLMHLQKLHLDFNRLTKIDPTCFTSMKMLTQLHLASNKIVWLDPTCFNGLVNLEIVYLSYNLLHEIDDELFQDQSKLTQLYLDNNRIKTINIKKLLENCRQLVTLVLNYNPLSLVSTVCLDADTASSVKYLYMTGTCLDNLARAQLYPYTNIKELNLNKNSLTSIGSEFLGLELLEELDLSDNQISLIKANAFQDLNGLKILNLCGNQIEFLDAYLFSNLDALIKLDLSNNKIHSLHQFIFFTLASLKRLKLSHNNLETLEFLSPLRSIERLSLSENLIKYLDPEVFSKLESLTELELSNNLLEEMEPSIMQSLRSIVHLDLSFNQFTTLNMSVFGQSTTRNHVLLKLNLSNNKFKTFSRNSFASLSRLEELNLSNNCIETINPFIFYGLNKLKALDLSFNAIQNLLPGTFGNLYRMKKLKLNGNNLENDQNMAMVVSEKFESLNLEECQIKKLGSFLPFGIDDDIFRHVKDINLSTCFIDENVLNKLNIHFPNLVSLTLQNCGLKRLREKYFSSYKLLETLDLSFNNIENLDDPYLFSGLTAIKKLKLNNNCLKNLDGNLFLELTNLTSLDLSGNALTKLYHEGLFMDLNSLTELYLQDNFIDYFDIRIVLAFTNKLEKLVLFDNKLDESSINSLMFSAITLRFELRYLDLSYNSLNDIEFVKNLLTLEELLLNNNQIKRISEDVLVVLGKLKSLNLEDNPFTLSITALDKIKSIQNLKLPNQINSLIKQKDNEVLESYF